MKTRCLINKHKSVFKFIKRKIRMDHACIITMCICIYTLPIAFVSENIVEIVKQTQLNPISHTIARWIQTSLGDLWSQTLLGDLLRSK